MSKTSQALFKPAVALVGVAAGFPTQPNPGNWGQVQAVAVQPDGKVIAGGQTLFDDYNGIPFLLPDQSR